MDNQPDTTKQRIERIAAALLAADFTGDDASLSLAELRIPHLVRLAAHLVAHIDNCQPLHSCGAPIQYPSPQSWIDGPINSDELATTD